MKSFHLFFVLMLASLVACSNGKTIKNAEEEVAVQDDFSSYDLNLFEAHGHVKIIKHIDYLYGDEIRRNGRDFVSIKSISEYYPLEEIFDENGKWTSISEKDLKRDSKGRIVLRLDPEGDMEYEWEDSLVTCYIDDHDSRYSYEYSNDGKKIKNTWRYKDPNEMNSHFVKKSHTVYHYNKFDNHGNWTERWGETYFDDNGTSDVHVDLRSIEYYNK